MVTHLIVASRNFAKAPKNENHELASPVSGYFEVWRIYLPYRPTYLWFLERSSQSLTKCCQMVTLLDNELGSLWRCSYRNFRYYPTIWLGGLSKTRTSVRIVDVAAKIWTTHPSSKCKVRNGTARTILLGLWRIVIRHMINAISSCFCRAPGS